MAQGWPLVVADLRADLQRVRSGTGFAGRRSVGPGSERQAGDQVPELVQEAVGAASGLLVADDDQRRSQRLEHDARARLHDRAADHGAFQEPGRLQGRGDGDSHPLYQATRPGGEPSPREPRSPVGRGSLTSSSIPEVSLAARPRARSSGVDRPAVAPRNMRSRVAGCFPRWWRRELASGRGSDSRRHGISIPRIVFTVLVVGCTADADPTAPLPETIAAGRSAWAAECAPCHTARDGFDIARFGFADADIVQRALGHVSSARPSRAVWNRGLRQEWR
jgi:hypothetical protein